MPMKKLLALSALASVVVIGCAAPTDQVPSEEAVDQEAQAWGEPTDTVPRVASPSSVQYNDEAIINAPVDVVWNLITDLPGYASWNPWVTKAEGSFTPGSHVKVDAKMGPVTQQFEHVVMTVTPKSFLCWRDS